MDKIYRDEKGYIVEELTSSRKDALAKEIKAIVLDYKNRILPVDRLAEKYKCSRADVFGAKNKIIQSLPKENIDFVRNKFKLQFDKLESVVNDLIDNSEDNDDLRKNVDLALKFIKEKTDYLERFHLKAKAQENIVIREEKQLVIDNIIDIEAPQVEK